MVTGSAGLSPGLVWTASIAMTTSMPSMTWPKTTCYISATHKYNNGSRTCLPSSHAVLTVQMKN